MSWKTRIKGHYRYRTIDTKLNEFAKLPNVCAHKRKENNSPYLEVRYISQEDNLAGEDKCRRRMRQQLESSFAGEVATSKRDLGNTDQI